MTEQRSSLPWRRVAGSQSAEVDAVADRAGSARSTLGKRHVLRQPLPGSETDPPAGFVQLQIARLSEAMIVARTMMMEGYLQAVDRMIKLTGEFDRYHGFAPARILAPPEPPPPRRLAARLSAKRSRREMAPQRLEKIESAPGNGMVSEASKPQDVVRGPAAETAWISEVARI